MDEKILVTIIRVEGLPCSIIGQEQIFSNGQGQEGNFKLPWNLSLAWFEEQLTELVKEIWVINKSEVANIVNPDEPDQIITVESHRVDGFYRSRPILILFIN
ncbi:MAG: hypothetical protein M0Z31_05045 [Clostridia bacterium]|nr:hypothetical protein [Clostridia bacterium]